MKLTKALTVPALTLAVLGAGLGIGAALPGPAAPGPSPSLTAPSPAGGVGVPTPCTESDPCWNCIDMGNRICGDPENERAGTAWHTFDTQGGTRRLKVDPSRVFRVEYVGYAVESPNLTGDQLGIVGTDGLWYVFEAAYPQGV